MSAATIARLKITLDAVTPAVLRRIEVPFDIRLDRLHLALQAAIGWTNSHLYEIRAGVVGWSTLYPEADWPEDFLDARKACLDKVIEDVGTKVSIRPVTRILPLTAAVKYFWLRGSCSAGDRESKLLGDRLARLAGFVMCSVVGVNMPIAAATLVERAAWPSPP